MINATMSNVTKEMFEKHYDAEDTENITLDGFKPFANSMPLHCMYIDRKRAKKRLKKCNFEYSMFMNVIYEKKQPIATEAMTKWKLYNEEYDVYVLDICEVFVKGKQFFGYCVVIVD